MPELKDYLEIGVALGRLFFWNLGLAYYYLPRSWRGGYRSPWDSKL